MAIRLIPFLVFLFAVAALAIAASGRLRSGQSIPPDPSRGRRRIVRWGFGLIGITLAVASAFSLGQRAIFLIAPLAISGYVADRKSTRLNSSHVSISYAVFCLKKKKGASGSGS